MASNMSLKTLAVLALALAVCVQATLGAISCEDLDQDTCAFSMSSSSKRCVLEKHCIKSCGLDRKSYGICSDSLLESRFNQKLCSPQCYDTCPNIVDLYFNRAASEGYFYQNCVKHKEQMLVDGCRRSVALDLLHQDRTNPPCKFGSTRTN
ncbi:uncharacterized protein Pyn_00678 [Prunus yedoensis var. nudiflora]|uniref:Uncharacterized protein n=1 Tax=Prunus yedoensis var. nudiflora TaxID=2094558 RepID=A0A314XK15_PRUYE|nr:uncharacterized protein Pyn_00678 [Prunus yedoensis var. nudiflora]